MSKAFEVYEVGNQQENYVQLTEKDMEYLDKLIHADMAYRRRRAAQRAYKMTPGKGDGSDATAIGKAGELRHKLRRLLFKEEDHESQV